MLMINCRAFAPLSQAVTVYDFLSAMEDANGADLSAIKPWYTQVRVWVCGWRCDLCSEPSPRAPPAHECSWELQLCVEI